MVTHVCVASAGHVGYNTRLACRHGEPRSQRPLPVGLSKAIQRIQLSAWTNNTFKIHNTELFLFSLPFEGGRSCVLPFLNMRVR